MNSNKKIAEILLNRLARELHDNNLDEDDIKEKVREFVEQTWYLGHADEIDWLNDEIARLEGKIRAYKSMHAIIDAIRT